MRAVGLDIVDAHVIRLEQDAPARGKARCDQVLHDFLLCVHRDRAPAGQCWEIDAVATPAEAQLDAVVYQSLAPHAIAHAALVEEVNRALLQHPGAHAVLAVLAAAELQHDRLDAGEMQQMREQQPGRSRADDADLGFNAH